MEALAAFRPHAVQLRKAPQCVDCGAPTSPVDALHRGNSLSAEAAGESTQRTTVAV